MPSRFIDELPAAHVTVESAPGLYGNTRPDDGRHFDSALHRDGFGARAARYRRQPLILEGRARLVEDGAAAAFALGERVFHQKFGYGHVKGIEGNKLEIAFDKAGTKKVMDSFIQPASEV